MPREFICHRCGMPNKQGAENCRFCGLQVGWRPSFPYLLRFWHWTNEAKQLLGSMAAAGAVTLEFAYTGPWVSYLFTLALLLLSSTILLSLSFSQLQEPSESE